MDDKAISIVSSCFFCANKYYISQTSRSISLWLNIKVNPSNPARAIIPRSHVLTTGKDGNDRALSKVAIGKVPNSYKAKFIIGSPTALILFSVTKTESDNLLLTFGQY